MIQFPCLCSELQKRGDGPASHLAQREHRTSLWTLTPRESCAFLPVARGMGGLPGKSRPMSPRLSQAGSCCPNSMPVPSATSVSPPAALSESGTGEWQQLTFIEQVVHTMCSKHST